MQVSTFNYDSNLNPYFITGLIVGEGCFTISISKSKKYKLGFRVEPTFKMELHSRDLALILELQRYFGFGSISIYKTRPVIKYSVSAINELTKSIIPHFENYPLLSQKAVDFNFFKQIVEFRTKEIPLTIEGFHKIVNIKASMNLGISDKLKSELKNITPVKRPVINTKIISDSN